MSAKEHARASRKGDEDDDLKRLAPDSDDVLADEFRDGAAPALPDLNAGPVEPAAWLALQQTLGNRAVGGLLEQRRAGQPLPPKARHDMEASFGRDFGQVQVHSGPEVDQAARALDAGAFTVADDIFVHSALPGFDSPVGREVLGEELAHVAQGVGREGIGRVTDPAETTEQEAHAAGQEAAAGEHAHVRSNHQAQSAVARSGIDDLIRASLQSVDSAPGMLGSLGAAAMTAQAAVAEPTELKDEDKDRLAAGALVPLTALLTLLDEKRMSAKPGILSEKALFPIARGAFSIQPFILSFTGPPAVQPAIEAAATAVDRGTQALLAASNPVAATQRSAGILSAIAGEIDALATPPQPATAPQPAGAPGAAPAAPADALTAAEADQLRLGGAEPLKNAAEQFQGDEPDLELILAVIKGVPGVLRSFSKPAALVPQLHLKAMHVEGQITRLEAVQAGPEAAIALATSEWFKATSILLGLTHKSAGGTTAAEAPGPGGSAGDEDKPNAGTSGLSAPAASGAR